MWGTSKGEELPHPQKREKGWDRNEIAKMGQSRSEGCRKIAPLKGYYDGDNEMAQLKDFSSRRFVQLDRILLRFLLLTGFNFRVYVIFSENNITITGGRNSFVPYIKRLPVCVYMREI